MITGTELASDDEYRFGTAICVSALQYAADKVSRDLMVAILLEHTDGSDDNRLSILLRTSATYYALAQCSDMKDAQCLVDAVARQSTTFEDICNGGPISFSCGPDLHASHHSRHLLVSYCELKTENTKNAILPDCRLQDITSTKLMDSGKTWIPRDTPIPLGFFVSLNHSDAKCQPESTQAPSDGLLDDRHRLTLPIQISAVLLDLAWLRCVVRLSARDSYKLTTTLLKVDPVARIFIFDGCRTDAERDLLLTSDEIAVSAMLRELRHR